MTVERLIMSYIVLHNQSTEEDFRYDVPQREAQALADLMGGGDRYLRLSWVVSDSSDDLMVTPFARGEARS
jgi:hypothetical protein